MYNIERVTDCLFGVNGYRQRLDPNYPEYAPDLLETSSGLIYDDNDLLSIRNLSSLMPFVIIEWKQTKSYNANEYVYWQGEYYISLQPNQGSQPDLNPLDWEVSPVLNDYIRDTTRYAINKLINRIYEVKKLKETVTSLIDDLQIFNSAVKMKQKIVNTGAFVGLEIVLKDDQNLVFQLNRVGTQFDEVNPNFPLYIFHSSQIDAIFNPTLLLTKAMSLEWTTLNDVVLEYYTPNYDSGGRFYIGYFQDDIEGQAIQKQYDFDKGPCNCSSQKYNYNAYQKRSKYVSITPFKVSSNNLNGDQLFDIDQVDYTYDNNWGLNLDFSIKCDLTDFICKQRNLFANALQAQVQYTWFEKMTQNVENDGLADKLSTRAAFELYGNNDMEGIGPLKKKLNDSIEAISFDMSDLNSVCIPCDQRGGITETAV